VRATQSSIFTSTDKRAATRGGEIVGGPLVVTIASPTSFTADRRDSVDREWQGAPA